MRTRRWYSRIGQWAEAAYSHAASLLMWPMLRWIEHKSWNRGVPSERTAEHVFVLTALRDHNVETVLDVGTGDSAFPALLALGGLHVVAVDPYRPYWRYGLGNWHWRVHRADIRDWEDGRKFDAVTCIGALEHVEYDVEMVQAMARHLKPGGILVITCPFSATMDVPDNCDPDPRTAICRVYTRKNLANWLQTTNGTLVSERHWKYFSGNHHMDGDRIDAPHEDFLGIGDYSHFLIQIP